MCEAVEKYIDRKVLESSSEFQRRPRRIGSLKGQRFISEGHDIDECNDEIVEMFGVEKRRVLGIADGKYSIPDNIDECNDEIAEMFGVNDG